MLAFVVSGARLVVAALAALLIPGAGGLDRGTRVAPARSRRRPR